MSDFEHRRLVVIESVLIIHTDMLAALLEKQGIDSKPYIDKIERNKRFLEKRD